MKLKGNARVVATGNDFEQINNVLVFPEYLEALDVRAKDITEEMKIAAKAIASIVTDEELRKNIIPNAFDKRV